MPKDPSVSIAITMPESMVKVVRETQTKEIKRGNACSFSKALRILVARGMTKVKP